MSDSFFRKAIQEKMEERNAQPGNDLWENIDEVLAKKRAERKKKNRGLIFWLMPLLLIGLSFGVFYFYNKVGITSKENASIATLNNEKEQTVLENEIAQISKNQRPKEKQTLIEKQQSKVELIIIGKTVLDEKNNNQIAEASFLNDDPKPVFSYPDFKKKISETEFNTSKVGLLSILKLKPNLLNISQLAPGFLGAKITESQKEEKETKIQKFSIGINYGINQLEYWSDEKTFGETAQLKLEYRFYKNLSAGIGLGFHKVNYDFEVDSVAHISAFGNTDKFPSFYKLKNDVEQIESRLAYFTLPVSLSLNKSITSRLSMKLTANQDFAYNQDQLLIYSFKSGAEDLEFRETNSKLTLGLTTFRLGFDYEILDGLKTGIEFNRIISFKTLGFERQYYHGFGGDFGVRYDF